METNDQRTPPSAALLERRAQFKAYLVARLGNESDAEDVLQNSLIKVVRQSPAIEEETRLTAWFYQVLRNALIDHVRSRKSSAALDNRWAEEFLATSPEIERAVCGCFASLIAELKPRHAALLQLVELEGQSVAAAALSLGLTPNNASVTLHRARGVTVQTGGVLWRLFEGRLSGLRLP